MTFREFKYQLLVKALQNADVRRHARVDFSMDPLEFDSHFVNLYDGPNAQGVETDAVIEYALEEGHLEGIRNEAFKD